MTKPLTVEQYRFYKTQEKPLSDAKIMEMHGLNNVQLNLWKHEHDLIGKKFEPNVKNVIEIDASKLMLSNPVKKEPEGEKAALVAEEKLANDEGLTELLEEIKALKAENERLKEIHASSLIVEVNDAVKAERHRQNELYGHQRHVHGDWLMILTEEVGEVAQAMQSAKGWGKSTDADNLYEELIHVAAVASAIAEQVLEEWRNGK